MVFYDRSGSPEAYMEKDDDTFFSFGGVPQAYLYSDAVYSFTGKQLGWFRSGWIRDLQGKCVFFTESTEGFGPIKPIRRVCPVKSVRQIKPIKAVREVMRVRPIDNLQWSSLSGNVFFDQ